MGKIKKDALSSAVSESDYEFISEIDSRFPKRSIKDKFNKFASAKPKERLDLAYTELASTVREYCYQLNVPEYLWQSVDEHQNNMVEILDFIGGSDDAKDQAVIHDVCETLTSDFTPRDDITKEEKLRLEELAANIVFEAYPQERAVWDEYEQRVTLASQETKDADFLELLTAVVHIEYNQPELHEEMEEVWYGPKFYFTTDKAKECYEELIEDRVLAAAGKKPKSALYKHMYG